MMNDNLHNLVGVSEKQCTEFLARKGELDRQRADLNKQARKLREEMKEAGVLPDVFEAMIKLAAVSREDQARRLTHSVAYLRFLRAPVGSQLTLDFQVADPIAEDQREARDAQAVEDAAGQGWRAGITGEVFETDCPYEENSNEGQTWIGAYREAQKQQTMALKNAAKKAKK